ncbi:radical SAM protein [candidate division KSB1 bacterium]|nr:radical SAM protein [candidate division KSB1 bacterium]
MDEVAWNLLPEERENLRLDIDRILGIYGEERVIYALREIRRSIEHGMFIHRVSKSNWLQSEDQLKKEIQGKNQNTCLAITEDCNLNCSYCIYSKSYPHTRNRSKKSMSRQVAELAMEYFLKMTAETAEPSLTFYGGEPLMNFDLINYFVDRIHDRGKKCLFNMTTNGTLLDPDVVKFLVKNEIYLLISLNGQQKIHDKYRKFRNGGGSFYTIWDNINFIYHHYPDYFVSHIGINCVLIPPFDLQGLRQFFNQAPISFLTLDVQSLDLYNSPKMSSLLTGEIINSYNKQLKELYDVFIQRCINGDYLDKFILNLCWNNYSFLADRNTTNLDELRFSTGQCIPGKLRMFIDSDGMLYPCERIYESVDIGDVYKGLNYGKILEILLDHYNYFYSFCKECWAQRFCSKCILDAFSGHPLDSTSREDECIVRRDYYKQSIQTYAYVLEKNNQAFNSILNNYIPGGPYDKKSVQVRREKGGQEG